MISRHQSIDNGIVSYHEKFQADLPKKCWVMVKKLMPIYGIIDIFRAILAYSLAKF